MTYAPAPVVPPSSREPVVRPACTTGVRPSAELNRPQAPLVEPRSGALVLNIGDIVQVWSNDRYRAPLHRVLASRDRHRYSARFFFNPSHDTVYRPLVSSCSAERAAATARSRGASAGPAAPRAITQTWARRSRSRTIGFERRVGKPEVGHGPPLPELRSVSVVLRLVASCPASNRSLAGSLLTSRSPGSPTSVGTIWTQRAADSWRRRDRFDLDEELLPGKRLHTHERAGRRLCIRPEEGRAGFANDRQHLGSVVDDEGRRLDEILRASSNCSKGGLQVCVDLARLGSEVPLADDLALGIEPYLAGDEDELAARHGDDLRVPGRLRELRRIEVLHLHALRLIHSRRQAQ